MRKNKQFEDILEECLERILGHGESVEQCLKLHPEFSSDLEPLLKTATAINRAVDIKPSAEFKARAAYQMRLEMAKRTPEKKRSHGWHWSPRWAISMSAAAAVLVMGSGTVFAADSSLPGSPLYPVKLVTEDVRISMAGSDIQKATLYAEFAEKRVDEMTRLVETGKSERVGQVAERFDNTVITMSNLNFGAENAPKTLAATAASPQAAPVTGEAKGTGAITTTTPTETVVPPALMAPQPTTTATLEPEHAENFATAATTDTTSSSEPTYSGDRSNSTVSSHREKDGDRESDEKSKLIQELSDNAKNHPEILRRLLESDDVSEESKIAIRRALYSAENGYKETIDKLDR